MDYEELNMIISELDEVPFPEVKYVVKNPMYANLLYDDLSGELGELSAITQYIYEHIEIVSFPELSGIMLKIAIQEMKHLNLVGRLIKRLGKKLYFIDSKGVNWNSKYVKYNFDDIVKTMKYNIETEKVAIERV